ncbi:MAG TPA: hypothetical protein VMS78_09980 [Rhizomicrobium sp.]|nr:hypothetical protein [Rhizomicrobium sp.]
MKPEAFDFLNNLSTIWAIIIGAVLATAGGLIATWVERNVDRRHRERNAALFFGEMLSTLDVIMEFALQARGVGDPYGPITMRFLRSARREIDIYDRNRETVFFLSDGVLRARIHTVILRLAMPIDGIFDITQEIALTEAQLKALPASDPDREDITKRIEELRLRRNTSFDFVGETAAQLKGIIADLEPIARQSFRQLAQVARS